MAEFEAPTAVGTKNNSVEDLKGLAEQKDVKDFHDHQVYQYYQKQYTDYLETFKDDLLVIEINEQLWPRLTGHTLAGPSKIAFRSKSSYIIDPLFLNHELHSQNTPTKDDYESKQNSSFTFFYLGDDLTGHAGIVHGGLLATILDEITCRLAFINFPSKKGVTASLNLNYKKPCYSDNYVLLRCDVINKSGRKCWVKGSVYKVDIDTHLNQDDVEKQENLLTECEILVIEPRWVNELKNKEN